MDPAAQAQSLRSDLDYLRVELGFARVIFALDSKAGFREDQHHDELGRWASEGGTARIIRIERTGNKRIDDRTELLTDLLREVMDSESAGFGPTYGVRIHKKFADVVKQLDLPGTGQAGVEQSFSLGRMVRYGLDGSIRTDVVMRAGRGPDAPIVAVWDLKTGSATLSGSRASEIRTALGINASVPVIELHAIRGINAKEYPAILSVKY